MIHRDLKGTWPQCVTVYIYTCVSTDYMDTWNIESSTIKYVNIATICIYIYIIQCRVAYIHIEIISEYYISNMCTVLFIVCMWMCRLQITHIKIMIESMAQVPWQKIQPCPKISLVQVQTLMLLALPRKKQN